MNHGFSREWISTHIAELINEGYEKAQAVKITMLEARKAYRAYHPHGNFPDYLHLKPRKPNGWRKKKNPSTSIQTRIRKASQLFEDFSGHEAQNAEKINVPSNPKVAIAIGQVEGIIYNTVRDGKHERYIHRFAAKSRPIFAVSYDGKQILMVGGHYDFTEKGIEDK
jgi:hypothetical protein